MQKTDEELHYDGMLRFIKLANEMANEGVPTRVVSAGLMTASCVYATYIEVGNEGSLDKTGVDRIADGYKKHLVFTQKSREEKARRSSNEKTGEAAAKISGSPEDA